MNADRTSGMQARLDIVYLVYFFCFSISIFNAIAFAKIKSNKHDFRGEIKPVSVEDNSTEVRSGVYFQRLPKRCYNAFLPMFYHFKVNEVLQSDINPADLDR